jgi:dienelactone hydrolase
MRLRRLLALQAFLLAGCGPGGGDHHGATPTGNPPFGTNPGSTDPQPAPARAVGTWYLDAEGERLTLNLSWDPRSHRWNGLLTDDNGVGAGAVDEIHFDQQNGILQLRRALDGSWQFFRAEVAADVLAGRFAERPDPDRPAFLADYDRHVTGWSDPPGGDPFPRVWEILVDGEQHARLRIDRSPDTDSGLTGRLKIYATVSQRAQGEQLEHDLEVTSWDGVHLHAATLDDEGKRQIAATAEGRAIVGSWILDGESSHFFSGARAEVLSYGLQPKEVDARAAWQSKMRRALQLLLMGSAPQPTSSTVTILNPNLGPTGAIAPPPDRDDDPDSWPQDYAVAEIQFDSTLADPGGGPDLHRVAHGFLATPNGLTDGAGLPAVVAVNGHDGSAAQLLEPDNATYWYGDAWARRGYVVLALDMSHRPYADRAALYDDYLEGDDPQNGNGNHPAVKSPGMDSDWEEDGERVWDVMRAIDYLQTLPGVDGSRIAVTGISMGGEVTTFSAALDPRVAVAVPSGFSPDLGVIYYNGNHECWRWQHADVREFLDASDLQSLVAPRAFLVETGRTDQVFSDLPTPFAADKQVARRARSAWADHPERYTHYLHYDVHHYHAGDVDPQKELPFGVQVPTQVAPSAPYALDWQTDGTTSSTGTTLFDDLATALAR